VAPEIAEAYRAGIERLLALRAPAPGTDGQLSRWQLRFSPDAYRSWKGFQRSIEVLMREGGKLCHLKDWASKLPGAAARIAGVMHCVCVSPEDSGIIGAAVMEQALNLCVLLIDHAIAVFDLMQRDPVMEDAQRVLRWIRREAKSQFSIRDCFCALQGHFKKVDTLYPSIRLLEQHGYVRPAPSTKAAGRPTEIYLVNPQFADTEA
jgi:putative DNA primase/helicase